jgi:8-oxo-dGTP pyrophosphatase MutT (NUDIX family)
MMLVVGKCAVAKVGRVHQRSDDQVKMETNDSAVVTPDAGTSLYEDVFRCIVVGVTERMSQETRSDPVRQVGAIAFQRDRATLRILVVSGRRDPSKWILPKGHIERGESEHEAVLRELYEEAGVSGIVLGPVESPPSFLCPEIIEVRYYLVRMVTERPSPEGREKVWLLAEQAVDRLSSPMIRELLRAALPALGRSARGSG